MKNLFLTIALSMAALAAFPQQTSLLTAEKHNEYGLVYTLPRTEIRIRLTATRQTRHAGPYYQYAKKYLGNGNVVMEDAEIWSITSAELLSYGVPDPEKRYLMQLKPGATTFMSVADNGMLLSINTETEQADMSPCPTDTKANPGPGVRDYLKYVDQDFTSSQSSAKQAEMLASSLMDVRDAYLSLTRGTADNMPTDGHQLDLMLSSLRDQELSLTRAFTGMTETEVITRDFTFSPQTEGRDILCRLSDFSGFVGKDDYSGDPVYITLRLVSEAELPVDNNGEEKKLPKDAVAYAIPATMEVTVSFAGDTLADQQMQMAQFGTVFGLAPSLFTDKKAPSYAIFDPATGALREIGEIK